MFPLSLVLEYNSAMLILLKVVELVLKKKKKESPGDLIAKPKCSFKHGLCIIHLGQREIWAGSEPYGF